MRIHRVYYPDITNTDREVIIEGQAATHLLRVLRIKPEQTVILFDGMGREYQSIIKVTGRNSLTATIESHAEISRESPLNMHLVQGISRGERMDWVLQKATELGVNHITPVYTIRSVVSLDKKRLESRMTHWRGVITHACEQCGRNSLPQLASPLSLVELLERSDIESYYYLDRDSKRRLNTLGTHDHITLIIGPEGGFDESEKQLMCDKDVHAISMGPRTLRTETAGIAAIAAIGAIWGDL